VVAERDAQTGGSEEEEEQDDLEPIDSEGPQIPRYCGKAQKCGPDQERT
jgi:hypothetical protein